MLAVITDIKYGHTTDGSTYDYYFSNTINAQDYYPFGMVMPGRKYLAPRKARYRYGFNGQEVSTEINDNLTTAEYWEYDSRIGRRWNVDPLFLIDQSPYVCFSNNPIINMDPNGDKDSSKTSLSAGQLSAAASIGVGEVVTQMNNHKLLAKNLNEMKSNIMDKTIDYVIANKLSLTQQSDFQNAVDYYFNATWKVADWCPDCAKGMNTTFTNNKISDEWKIGLTNFSINKQDWKWQKFLGFN